MKSRRSSLSVPALLLIAGFFAAAANQAKVQIFARADVLESARAADRLFVRGVLPAARGDILSSDGKVLARSSQLSLLGLDPKRAPLSPALWSEMATATGVSAAEMMDLVARGGRVGTWEVAVSSRQASEIARIKSKFGADGIWLDPAGERDYPLGALAAPIVGYVEGAKGVTGIEASQNPALAGRSGRIVGMTDRAGNYLPWLIQKNASQSAVNGADVTLTIDSDIQKVAMRSLAQQCEKHKATSGAAVVLDARTGDVLALASWPSYDPKRPKFAQADMAARRRPSPELNPAVGLAFEPGSTFKVFTIALGLDSGALSLTDAVQCAGSKQFSVARIHCAGDDKPKAHGSVTPAVAVEASCNVAAATWGVKIGFERYSQFIRRLGILETTRVGLQPEAKGLFRFTDYNKTIQMANVGFGQSMNATPIGLASAFTVFANKGVKLSPRLIRSVGGLEQPRQDSVRLFTSETARTVLRFMEAAVQGERGTAKSLRIPGYTLAGKTGTAQKIGSSAKGRYVSSFVGYVPARQPRAVVLVMIDSPSTGGYYGAVVAGPAFKQIAQFLIQELNIAPDKAVETAVAPR